MCSCVSVHWCALHLHVGAADNAPLTLWLGRKSPLVRLSWFGDRSEGWLTYDLFCVWRRSSLSGAPVSGLMIHSCPGAPWALAKWPGRMTTLCSDPWVPPWPSVYTRPPAHHPPSITSPSWVQVCTAAPPDAGLHAPCFYAFVSILIWYKSTFISVYFHLNLYYQLHMRGSSVASLGWNVNSDLISANVKIKVFFFF